MQSFKDLWLEKIAESVPSHKHTEYADKEHKHSDYATKVEAKDIAEDVVEDHEEKLHDKKAGVQASDITNSPKPVLVVAFMPQDEMSKQFVQRLDKVLASTSGLDRLQIKAINLTKNKATSDQLKSGHGISLFKGGKLIGSVGFKSSEQEIKKFIDAHKRDII